MEELPSFVYEKYLDRLAELPTDEMDKIYNAYTHIKQCIEIGQQTRRSIESGNATVRDVSGVIGYCNAALESISIALSLFEGGKEILDSMQKERGKQLELIDKYIELTGVNGEEQ